MYSLYCLKRMTKLVAASGTGPSITSGRAPASGVRGHRFKSRLRVKNATSAYLARHDVGHMTKMAAMPI